MALVQIHDPTGDGLEKLFGKDSAVLQPCRHAEAPWRLLSQALRLAPCALRLAPCALRICPQAMPGRPTGPPGMPLQSGMAWLQPSASAPSGPGTRGPRGLRGPPLNCPNWHVVAPSLQSRMHWSHAFKSTFPSLSLFVVLGAQSQDPVPGEEQGKSRPLGTWQMSPA